MLKSTKIPQTKRRKKVKKEPFATQEKLQEIIKEYPTPFHLYDEKGIRENAKAVQEAFAWNAGFREYFAVKATPNPFLIQILKEYGCGVDCSSMTELMLSEAIGFSGHDIMFSSNDTPAEEFAFADQLGAVINLDDFTHIDFLEQTIGKLPETISCRYNPGGVFKISNAIMDNPQDAKYGFTKQQLIEGFKILKQKGVKNFGVHAFLASNTVTNDYYPILAKTLFETVVELKRETGCDIRFINLSGGVGIPYSPDQTPNDIRVIGEGVRKVYEETLVPAGMGDVAIYTEMGRFMMGPYGCLVTKAIHEKHTYKEYIGVDACAVNLMRPAMYGAYHHITVMGKDNSVCNHKYDITGSLCENNDKFAVDRMLPKIEIGDLLVIHDTGAHGFAMGYNYNGKLKSAEILLKQDGSFELIRRAETPKDYFSTFDCFNIYEKIKKHL
jgi:diaminopimelate decarboxylase